MAPRRRGGRGKKKSHEITTKVARDGKITIKFDEAKGTWQTIGDYSPWFASVIDIHTRDIYDPFHNAWKDLDPQHKKRYKCAC